MENVAIPRPGRIGLRLERWREQENQFLRDHYHSLSMEDLRARLPKRTKSAILQQAGILGLWGNKRSSRTDSWANEELEVLETYYPENGILVCEAFLPGKSRYLIQEMVKHQSLRKKGDQRSNRIPKQEWDFIFANVERIGFVACAEKIADTPDNLRDKCSRKGIDCDAIDLAFNGGPFREGAFSETEDSYIIENFPHKGGVRVALELGRSPKTLINYAKRRLHLRAPSRLEFPPFSVFNPCLIDSETETDSYGFAAPISG